MIKVVFVDTMDIANNGTTDGAGNIGKFFESGE